MAKQAAKQIAIIGGGMIARAHIENFKKDRRTQVRWLVEIDAQRRSEMVDQFNIPRSSAEYEDALNDDAVAAVVLCTPPFLHKPMALAAMRADKHLLIEKPLGLNPREGRSIMTAAGKKRNLKVSGASYRHARTTPKWKLVKGMIDDGKLGQVYYVHHRCVGRQGRPGIEYNPGAKWFLDRKLAGGGPLFDWGVYDFSFHLGVLGEPELDHVSDAFCRNELDHKDAGTKTFTVEEHGAAMMQFAGGMRYFYERASNAHFSYANRTQIIGTEGGLSFGYCTWDPGEVEFYHVDRAGKGKARLKTYKAGTPKSHAGDMPLLGKAFTDYLCDAGECPMPLELELKNLKILDAIYRKADWTG